MGGRGAHRRRKRACCHLILLRESRSPKGWRQEATALGTSLFDRGTRERCLSGQRLNMSMTSCAPAETAAARCGSGRLLAINGGSSSIRFALYDGGERPWRLMNGKVDRIGLSGTTLSVEGANGQLLHNRSIDTGDRRSTVRVFLDWLRVACATCFGPCRGTPCGARHGAYSTRTGHSSVAR